MQQQLLPQRQHAEECHEVVVVSPDVDVLASFRQM